MVRQFAVQFLMYMRRLTARQWRLAGAAIMVILTGAVLLMQRQGEATASPSTNSVTVRALSAQVSWSSTDFLLENLDDVTWSRCKFEVNGQTYGDGYGYLVESVPPNKRLALPMRAFLKTGQSYDNITEPPGRFTIRCQDVEGETGVYLGRAQPATE